MFCLRKIITLVIVSVLSLTAQENYWLQQLSTPNKYARITALHRISLGNMTYLAESLIPLMEEEEDGEVLVTYLKTLFYINYNDICPHAVNLMSRIDDLFPVPEQNYEARVKVTFILISCGDLSGEDLMINYVANNMDNLSSSDIRALDYLLKANTPRKEEIKDLLMRVPWEASRLLHYSALSSLKQENDIVPFLLHVLKDPELEYVSRITASHYLEDRNYECNPLFRDLILNDLDSDLRYVLALKLLCNYGSPSDLKFIIEYIPNEPDPVYRNILENDASTFIPPSPDNLSALEKIQTLAVYIGELYQYQWINDNTAFIKLSNNIATIEEYYLEQNKDGLHTFLKQFFDLVEVYYKEGTVTGEGYKFLYHYADYIKQSVEVEF